MTPELRVWYPSLKVEEHTFLMKLEGSCEREEMVLTSPQIEFHKCGTTTEKPWPCTATPLTWVRWNVQQQSTGTGEGSPLESLVQAVKGLN